MQRKFLYGLIMAGATLAGIMTSALAEPINVKTGLWGTTLHTAAAGQLPISPQELQQMSPQMRAAAEKMLANGARPRAIETKSCVTQKDLDTAVTDFLAGEPNMKCSNKLTNHTSSHAAGTFDCTKGSMHQFGNFSLDILDHEHVRGNVNMTFNNDGNAMTSKGTVSSHWISASCGKTR